MRGILPNVYTFTSPRVLFKELIILSIKLEIKKKKSKNTHFERHFTITHIPENIYLCSQENLNGEPTHGP